MAGRRRLTAGLLAGAGLGLGAYFGWRHLWFFRDPARMPPAETGILSPADGTVVYVREVAPNDDVVVIKRGLAAKVKDIVKEDVETAKMSSASS